MKATQFIPERVTERAFTRFTIAADGCYISTYSTASHGYAQIGWKSADGRMTGTTAHRAAWTHINGQIPDGMTIDHICKNRPCVNVEHLRMLTNFENARRTSGRDWPLGQCINGHPNSELRTTPSGSKCGICAREWSARWERENKDRAAELRRRYIEANPEKVRESKRRSQEKRKLRREAERRAS